VKLPLKRSWMVFLAIASSAVGGMVWVHLSWTLPLLQELRAREEVVSQREQTLRRLRQRLQREGMELEELKRRRAELKEELKGWSPVRDPYKLVSVVKERLRGPIARGTLRLENYQVKQGKGATGIVLAFSADVEGLEDMLGELEEMPGLYIRGISVKKVRRPKGRLDLSVRVQCISIGG